MQFERVADHVGNLGNRESNGAPESKNWQEQQARRWESEAHKLEAEWRQQQEWIAVLEEAKKWHEQQASRWEPESRKLANAIVDYYWESPSWKALRPIRRVAHTVLGLPAQRKPQPNGLADAWRVACELQESWSWNATAPLRFGHVIFRSLGRAMRRLSAPPNGGKTPSQE
jgi:hypothetical protein